MANKLRTARKIFSFKILLMSKIAFAPMNH